VIYIEEYVGGYEQVLYEVFLEAAVDVMLVYRLITWRMKRCCLLRSREKP
jgi:hypothetical protein